MSEGFNSIEYTEDSHLEGYWFGLTVCGAQTAHSGVYLPHPLPPLTGANWISSHQPGCDSGQLISQAFSVWFMDEFQMAEVAKSLTSG